MTLYKIIYIFLLFLIYTPCFSQENHSDFTFLGNDNIPPILYNENSKAEGLVVDIVYALANNVGLNINITAMNWSEAQNKLKRGEADALLQINHSEEREVFFDFSNPLLLTEFCIFRNKERLDIKDLKSLFGLTVGVEAKGYPTDLLEQYPEINIKIIKNWENGFRLLKSNKIDAIIVDKMVGEYHLSKYKIGGIIVINKPVVTSSSCIAVKKGNYELLNKINLGLEQIEKNGEKEKIISNWSSVETVYLTRENYLNLLISIIVLMLLLLLFLLFFIYKSHKHFSKIEESELMYKALFKDSHSIMLIIDSVNGDILDANESACKYYGYSYGIITQLKITQFYSQPIKEVETSLEYLINENQPHVISKHKLSNDEIRDVEVFTGKIEISKKVVLCSIIYDITDRNQAELEKQQLLEQLHQSQKMEAIGHLVGGIAHDFNNILCGIIGSAELLQSPKRNLDEKSHTYVNIILQASERATKLISNLLIFSRKEDISLKVIDIHLVIEDMFLIITNTINKKITVSIQKDARNSLVLGDSTILGNTLLNLCINGSHAIKDEGEIKITSENISLNKSYCDSSSFDIIPGDYIKVSVHDTGSGIKPEFINKIFDPFFTTNEQGHGTGLGLSTVYGSIVSLNGEILVKSKVGIGTTFEINLPCTKLIAPIAEGQSTIPIRHGTILVVDDEEMNCILYKDILESFGYKVLLAKDGVESIEIFSDKYSEINIVLMDMIMPRMNGSEAFYKMKEIDENCKVIIMSGYTRDENIEELIKFGLASFINKPFSVSEISKVLDSVQNIKL